jgi:hypothetical protein
MLATLANLIVSYLCKPRDQSWDAGILGLEAGSGYGALKRLLGATHPHLFSSLFPKSKPALSPTDRAYAIYTHLRAFLLTHAHLDHAASLIISAGSLPGPTKYILGAQGVLDDLERCIFTPGRCWPNIVGWDGNTSGGKLKALPVALAIDGRGADRDEDYTDLGVGIDSVRVRVVPLSHGGSCAGQPHPRGTRQPNGQQDEGVYRSSAFFVRHAPTRHEFLFFGDVEADPVPPAPLSPHSTPTLTPSSTLDSLTDCEIPTRPLLFPVWQHTAHLFTSSRLHTLLLECSWPAGRPTAQLFGHLGVEQVRREMRVLAGEVVKARETVARAREIPEKGKSDLMAELSGDTRVPATVRSASTRPRTRRAHTESPPRVTRGAKRKAAHLSLNPASPVPVTPPRPTRPLVDTEPLTGALTGLRVIVIHCKEPTPGFDLAGAPTIADYIVRQLREGAPGLGSDELGVEYVAAHQGDEFGERLFLFFYLGWDGLDICVDRHGRPLPRDKPEQDANSKVLPPTFLVL